MKTIAILTMAVMLSACSSHTGKQIIQGANLYKAIGSMTTQGVKEETLNCVKDIFDPGNRGSGC